MQYYTDRRHIDISGDAYTDTAKYYDPLMARKIIDFNLVVTQSTDTPVFRAATDDMLMQLFQAGAIPLELFLDNTSMPFAEKLKNDLKQLKEQTMTGPVDPALAAQVSDATPGSTVSSMESEDPRTMAMAKRFLG